MGKIEVKMYRVPFMIVLLSMCVAWFSAIIKNDFAYKYLPELALLIFLIFDVIVRFRCPKIDISWKIIFFVLLAVYIITILDGLDFGVYGVCSIFVMVFIFNYTLKVENIENLPVKLLKQVSIVYIINIIFILLENIVALTHNSMLLVNASSGQYRTDLYAPLSKLVEGFSAGNSLLLKAQSASILLVSAVVWFWDPFRLGNFSIAKEIKYRKTFLLLAVFLFISQATMTSLISLLIVIIALLFILPKNKLIKYKTTIIIVGIIFSPLLINLILFKVEDIYSIESYGGYVNAFIYPLLFLHQLDPLQLFLGLGDLSKQVNHWPDSEFAAADFGIVVIILQGGIIVFIMAAYFLFSRLIILLQAIRRCDLRDRIATEWIHLSLSALLGVIIWIFSLGH